MTNYEDQLQAIMKSLATTGVSVTKLTQDGLEATVEQILDMMPPEQLEDLKSPKNLVWKQQLK